MKKLIIIFVILVLCGCSNNENTFSTISSYMEKHDNNFNDTYMPQHYFNDEYSKTLLSEEETVTVYCINSGKHIYHMLFNVDGMTIAYWFNHSEDVNYRYFIERLEDSEDFRYYYMKDYNYVSVMYKDDNIDMCIDFSEYDQRYSQEELIEIGMDILHDTILLNKKD